MKDERKVEIVKTGDTTSRELYTMLFSASVGALGVFSFLKYRKRKELDNE